MTASPASDNIYHLFESRFPADPAAPFIETPDGRVRSYGDLAAESARYAHVLAERGVRKGDRVAVQVEKSPEAISLYLACQRAGAIYLPLNTAYTAAEVEYFLTDAEPRLVVASPALAAQAEPLAAKVGAAVLTLDAEGGGSLAAAAAGRPETFDTVPAAADDICAILYSSGTTGRPKGAMMSHRNIGSNALTLHRLWGFRPGDVLLHALPIFHTHGLFVATNCVLLNGSSMLFLPKFDLEPVLRLLPRATVMMGVPTYYVRLLAEPRFTPELCRGMRLFISGSAPLLAETWNEFKARTGHPILERYGMTETGMNTSNPLDGERRPGTVGFPLPDVALRIAGEDGRVLPAGEIGQIEVKGPNVFKGYWRMPEKTAQEFTADGFFRTGDLGIVDERGYVSIVGRGKDLVISGGFNVYPKEVETCIDEIPGVDESAVIGLAHRDFGEAVAAVVTLKPGAAVTPEQITAACRAQLANYKVPKAVFVVEALPRNTMGKVQKNLLREQYKATFAG
ncbi:MAG TPA: malonyl-CoA synthase [Alphaproteobacteria bacterium]|nr:malonyl-CoA synthase [Alphaproteobacteria bacterium]